MICPEKIVFRGVGGDMKGCTYKHSILCVVVVDLFFAGILLYVDRDCIVGHPRALFTCTLRKKGENTENNAGFLPQPSEFLPLDQYT